MNNRTRSQMYESNSCFSETQISQKCHQLQSAAVILIESGKEKKTIKRGTTPPLRIVQNLML